MYPAIRWVIDWEAVGHWSSVLQLLFTFAAAVATTVYVVFTHRIMKATLAQADAATALSNVALAEKRHQRMLELEKLAEVCSVVETHVSFLQAQIVGLSARSAARDVAKQRAHLLRTRDRLISVDSVPMSGLVRLTLRSVVDYLSVFVYSLPSRLDSLDELKIDEDAAAAIVASTKVAVTGVLRLLQEAQKNIYAELESIRVASGAGRTSAAVADDLATITRTLDEHRYFVEEDKTVS